MRKNIYISELALTLKTTEDTLLEESAIGLIPKPRYFNNRFFWPIKIAREIVKMKRKG